MVRLSLVPSVIDTYPHPGKPNCVQVMKACLKFSDIVRLSKPQIQEMKRLGEASRTGEGCEVFSRQVTIVEGVLIHTYGIAAELTKRLDDLQEITLIWGHMSSLCNDALIVLAGLKKAYPPCGASELYDRVLDVNTLANIGGRVFLPGAVLSR
jgi:hypothetical protein